MDGIAGDRFAAGRRVRPATQEFAVTTFPSLIIALIQGVLQVDTANSAGFPEMVKIWVPPLREEPLAVLRSDFEIIKKIASNSSLRIFPSDTLAVAEARIRAQVKVEFAGRGVPT